MSDVELNEADVARLQSLAAVLIASTDTMPAPASIAGYEGLLRRAVRACGWSDDEVRAAIDAIPTSVDWAGASEYESTSPDAFHVVSMLLSAAYFMAPQVLELLRYPTNRRHPAGLEDFANEFGTGILDPVLALEPRFRDTR